MGGDYFKKTSGDTLILLKHNNMDADLFSKLSAALRSGDAVKFAKYLPPSYETELSMLAVKEYILLIESVTNASK